MMWEKTPDGRHCEKCGVIFERWVLRKFDGHRLAEATFCPVCSPEVKKIFATADMASDAA